MGITEKLLFAIGFGPRRIRWYHGSNRKYECFGDDLCFVLDPNGPFEILEARSPALKAHQGKRVVIKSRAVTAALTGILIYVDALLEREEIPHWINSGTLLGAVRHQSVIPWDNDGDMMIRVDDADRVAALQAEIEQAGFLFAVNKKFGPGYKMYVKSKAMPKIMVEICSMYPQDITLDTDKSDTLWTYHPFMVEAVRKRVERIHETDPTNEIGLHRFTQRESNDILIDNQYLSSEIFPIQRIPFAGQQIAAPANPHAILNRDYGSSGLSHGLVSCACQWTDGDYLLKVAFPQSR